MADTNDIALTVDDVRDMDPKIVVQMYDKLREDRTKVRDHRDELQKTIATLQEQVRNATGTIQQLNAMVAARNAVLAEVAGDLLQANRELVSRLNAKGKTDAS